MMVFGATAVGATANDDDTPLGSQMPRRLSSSVDGSLGRVPRRGGGKGGGGSTKPLPEAAALVLGNFQGVVVMDMGLVAVGSAVPLVDH